MKRRQIIYQVLVALVSAFALLFALQLALAAPNSKPQQNLTVSINIDDFVPGGRVTSGYCERTRNGTTETHPGVDIAVISGTESLPITVTAGITGHVEATYPFTSTHYPTSAPDSEWLHNFNTVVISDATSHNFFVYAHFSQIMPGIVASTTVTPDTPIGVIGGMGAGCEATFGNHLHLEIRENVGSPGWGAEELGLTTSGTKTHAISPTLTLGPNISTTVSSQADDEGGGIYMYSYEIINDSTSHLPVEILRIGYDGKSPYQVTSVPAGWIHTIWDESPDWIWFYATDPTVAVEPGTMLGGFAYVSLDPPGYVPYFVAYDDAGHDGGLGRTEVTVWGVSDKRTIYLPVVLK
jgi:murein DD-endopeptidase MepM/ murein hydrolase activator NlpD